MTSSPDAIEHDAGLLQARLAARRGRPHPRGAARPALGHPRDRAQRQALSRMLRRPPRSSTACSICAAGTRWPPPTSQSVAVEIGETQATILRNHRPQNALDAKFSAEFAIAAAAVAGDCGLAELTDAFVRRSDVQDVFPKVSHLHPYRQIAGGAGARRL